MPGWCLWNPALQNRFSGAMERIDSSKSAIIRTLSSRSTHLDEEILCYLSPSNSNTLGFSQYVAIFVMSSTSHDTT
ncbi:hypothetical protein BYT27DRAFT_7193078 [Phlegmacium glaucopus]|nr:hypothetical protein BYT27DRAFT_7193078 [Phlegmacium glaucopus]